MATGSDRTERVRPDRSTARWPVLTALALAILVGGAVAAVWAWRAMGSDAVSTVDDSDLGHVVVRADPESAAGADAVDGADEASMTATLHDGQFELSGRLPSSAVVARVREVAAIVYGTSEVDLLTVEESLPDPSWGRVAGDVIASLPLISNGGIVLEGESATLSGVAGSDEKHARFKDAVEQILGPAVELTDEIEVVEQLQPVLLIEKRAPTVIELEGLLPRPQVAQRIQETLAETYTGHSFQTDFAFDADVEETFTLHSLPRLAGMLAKFPVWQVSYLDGAFTSSSAGATSFEFDSAALPMDTTVLDSFAMSLIGGPALRLTVTGHTDSTGPAGYNLGLSERRAATVVEYLVLVHGIDPARVTSIGYGEEHPIAPNTSADGRMKNRRVDFVIEIPTG